MTIEHDYPVAKAEPKKALKPKEPPKVLDHWVNEYELKDLDGSTLDSAVTAQARFFMMKKKKLAEGGGCLGACHLDAYFEFGVSVFMHLLAQIFQFVLLTYFIVGMVKPMGYAFRESNIVNMTSQIEFATAANNHQLVDFNTKTVCSLNLSFLWTHRLMMFVLIAKMLPDIMRSLWYMYEVWKCGNADRGNHDVDQKKEKELISEWPWSPTANKDLAARLNEEWLEYESQAGMKEELKWRDYEKVVKEGKARYLIMNKYGISFKYKNLSNPMLCPKEGDYPLKVIEMEVDEVHNIGHFYWTWKIFITLFILIPTIILNSYITAVGTRLIAYSGNIAKLIKNALKVKFILAIPENMFEGYMSETCKEYVEGTVYFEVVKNDTFWKKSDDGLKVVPGKARGIEKRKLAFVYWDSFGSTFLKIAISWILAVYIYDHYYGAIVTFRATCSAFYDHFEGQGLAKPAAHLSAW